MSANNEPQITQIKRIEIMKQYAVDVDITMSKRIYVDAESEQEARKLVEEKMKYPHYYYTKADAYVKHEITDVYEEETEPDEDNGMGEALEYVREQIGCVARHLVRETATKNMNERMPASGGIEQLADKIQDLLEEYGQDNDLPEGWWMELGDIDDWLEEL